MPNPTAAQSGNLKLRGLLRTSRDLLRKRQLKKAIYSAQIAQDFAIRSGEGPGIAASAQLIMAEAYILNAAYTYDDKLRSQGWRLLEQLEANSARSTDGVDLIALRALRALCQRRLGNFEVALHELTTLSNELTEDHPQLPEILVQTVATIAQMGDRDEIHQYAARAVKSLERVAPDDRTELVAILALANAHRGLDLGQLTSAIDEAHVARRLSQKAGLIEIEALSTCFLGKLSRMRGNHQIALRLLYDAMDLAERMEYRPLVLDTHLEIGQVFATLQNDREAEKYFSFVAEEAAAIGLTESVYASSIALGCAAHKSERYSEANTHFGLALQAATQLEWLREQGIVLSEMAALKLDEEQAGLAVHLVEEAQRRFKRAGQQASAKTYLTLARIAVAEPDAALPEVLRLSQKARELAANEDQLETQIEALRLKASAYAAQEEYVEALACEQESGSLAIKLLHAQRERQLPDLNMRAALQQKEREIEELTRENDLKNALVDKNDEIERANQELMQANEELRQFAFVASHDLKEPLRQIGSYVGLLKRHYLQDIDERGETFYGYVSEGVARLNRLLDSLMHYTTIARIDNEGSNVQVGQLVDSIEQELRLTVARQQASITYERMEPIFTSAKLLRHVLFALIDNALKFGRPNVPPVIRISLEEYQGQYRIGVHDNGIGIREEYQDKVFTLFQMLHAKSEYPGTGVGLAIAQKTVQRLGGRIWFTSASKEVGTSFYLTLPMLVERSLPVATDVDAFDAAEAA